jgi:hypothetical protein
MTEAEWQTCEDWRCMLAYLSRRWTSRKATLYLCAGLRCIWDLLYDEASKKAVEVAERAADGTASDDEVSDAAWSAECPTFGFDFDANYIRKRFSETGEYDAPVRSLIEMGVYTEDDIAGDMQLGDETIRKALLSAADLAESTLHLDFEGKSELQKYLLGKLNGLTRWPNGWLVREIIGNPFRHIGVSSVWLTWNESTISRMAQGIYDDRAFDLLPILADALEDAGCDNADILNHCRQPGEHARGCWVVDLLLGKE